MNRLIPLKICSTRKLVHRCLVRTSYSVQRACSNLNQKLQTKPNHEVYEQLWYKHWEDQKLFTSPQPSVDKSHYSLILPPPNITGDLHLGHALTIAIEDALYRYHRMSTDKDCIWIPGYDHAGIAMQLVIDKLVRKEQETASKPNQDHLNQADIDRIASKWTQERISSIRSQMKRIGAGLDFSREFFTMSPPMSRAVREAFIRLFEQNLIYRSERIVNWSYYLKSTLSDIEIDWIHFDGPKSITVPGHSQPVEFGTLHSFAYPIEGLHPRKELVVSTTRLECMAGDTAIAVHPNDERYKDLIGRNVIHPFTGHLLPIIADQRIEMSFGTGAMKVTPSHSAIDFQLAQDHGLKIKCVYDNEGNTYSDELLPQFQHLNGLNRFKAKDVVREALINLGLYRGMQPHKTVVPTCARSGDVIEGNLLPQWFIRNEQLVADLEEALEQGTIEVEPKGYKNSWLKWLGGNEWCISRQISWGHRIPAFRIAADGRPTEQWVAAHDETEALAKAKQLISKADLLKISVEQDSDVLDTWFSSGLLPFTALGWPNREQDFKRFYPLSLMETGYDILGLWVSRMASLSKRLTGDWSFRRVLLHGMVCDGHGKKMTKSLGNVIDPLHVINGVSIEELHQVSNDHHHRGLLTDQQLKRAHDGQRILFPNGIPACGADALRLSLFKQNSRHQILRLSVGNITDNRHLINKFWQTYRLFEMNYDSITALDISGHRWASSPSDITRNRPKDWPPVSIIHQWILSRLSQFVTDCNRSLQDQELHTTYARAIEFWVDELCDYYLESIKPTLHSVQKSRTKVNGPAESISSNNNMPLASNDDSDPGQLFSATTAELSDALNCFQLCLRITLKLVHPLVPFVSEELWQRLRTLTSSTASNSSPEQLINASIADNLSRTSCQTSTASGSNIVDPTGTYTASERFDSILEQPYPGSERDPNATNWPTHLNQQLDSTMQLIRLIVNKLRSIIGDQRLSRSQAQQLVRCRILISQDGNSGSQVGQTDELRSLVDIVVKRLVPIQSIHIELIQPSQSLVFEHPVIDEPLSESARLVISSATADQSWLRQKSRTDKGKNRKRLKISD